MSATRANLEHENGVENKEDVEKQKEGAVEAEKDVAGDDATGDEGGPDPPAWFLEEFDKAWERTNQRMEDSQMADIRRWEAEAQAKMTEAEKAARPKVVLVAVERSDKKGTT